MPVNQGCKKCRTKFLEGSNERNYSLYSSYGFNSYEEFMKHNSRNRNCPCKQPSILNQPSSEIHNPQENNEYIPIPLWPPYKSNTDLITQYDYSYQQDIAKMTLTNHIEGGGNQLWFDTTEEAAWKIIELIMNISIQWITLVAEPGSGKTMVLHYLIYIICARLPYDKSISPNSITLTTGMSDKEWYNQVLINFKLRNGKYLWDDINKLKENNCIVHRSNFNKRIRYLLNNPDYISNHIFLIDESHFADDPDMTIDKEFKRLGLTEERMKEYNIKVIFVSATPDVNLSLMSRQDNHKLVQLKNGSQYKGFNYFNERNVIHDYDNEIDIDTGAFIRSHWSSPRYHYIRARTQQEKGEYRIKLMFECESNGWRLIEDDSDNNYYLSFCNDRLEKLASDAGKIIIKTYEEPEEHTFILIKNKYQASKRLKITKYTGLISEKPAKKMNTSITCNGLIPRFFGYDTLPEFQNNEMPLFLCNKDSINEYITFSNDFVYEGTDYTSRRIVSNTEKVKELKETAYGQMANITAQTHDSKIGISEPFDSTSNIAEYLLEECGFRNANIEVRDINFDPAKSVNGYIYPKRKVPGHTWDNHDDTFLTKEIYIQKFRNKGQGSNINRQGNNASGQCFMVYPVYENSESSPQDVKFYVHYLIVNSE